jgi:cytochrome c-type biogenesis protein CcmH/NrfG
MNEWWFVILLSVIAVFSSLLMVYPFRRHVLASGLLFVVILGALFGGYYSWGGFGQWQDFIQQRQMEQRAQQLLKTVKGPQELIERFKIKLVENPKSAKGWFLLGRLYSSQNDMHNAGNAFAKAYQLEPEDEQFAVSYTYNLWMLHHQQFNSEIIGLFKKVVEKNPNQPDALAMLAMEAFKRQAYEEAITYWQRLLKLAPEDSDEANAIHQAIAKAHNLIKG